MPHRIPERFRRLARERAARAVGDRAGNHDWKFDARFVEGFKRCEAGRLGVQRVEDRFYEDDVGSALDQRLDLILVGRAQFVEVDVAIARIANPRRDGRGAVGRADGARDEARLIRRQS